MGGPRIIGSAAIAVGITVGLFFLMSWLITRNAERPDDGLDPFTFRFEQVKLEDDTKVRDRRIPKKPPPPKEPPPPPKMQVANVNKPISPIPNLNVPNLDVPFSGSGPFMPGFVAQDLSEEGDIIPLVRIQPQYPRRAAIAKIEGWVEMEFTITSTGTVADVDVLRSKPPRVFDREAIRALLKWKFKPRVVDGVAVDRRATQTIEFKLDGI